jgi:hypothetical protein
MPGDTAIGACPCSSVRPRESAALGDGAANRRLQVFIDQTLGDEVRGTRLQGGVTDAIIVHRGEHDDLYGGSSQMELPARLDAVAIRQRDIQDDDVGLAEVDEVEHFRCRRGVSDQVAVVLEQSRQCPQQGHIVIGQEDARFRRRPLWQIRSGAEWWGWRLNGRHRGQWLNAPPTIAGVCLTHTTRPRAIVL